MLEARGFKVSQSLYLHLIFLNASSKGSSEFARIIHCSSMWLVPKSRALAHVSFYTTLTQYLVMCKIYTDVGGIK